MAARWRPEGIDHVGIAVRSIAVSSRLYAQLGVEVGPLEHLPDDAVTAAFAVLGAVRIELLEPLGPEGPVARFLARRGEGIHHIAFAVGDIVQALEHARREGFRLIDDVPRRGAHNSRVAFLHPKDTHGVLVELVERAAS
jgi:methylmalonyl-CoA epimerase